MARPSRKSPPIEITLEVTEKTKRKYLTYEEVNDWDLFLKSLILKLQHFKQILRINIEAKSRFGMTKLNDYLPNLLKSTKLCQMFAFWVKNLKIWLQTCLLFRQARQDKEINYLIWQVWHKIETF